MRSVKKPTPLWVNSFESHQLLWQPPSPFRVNKSTIFFFQHTKTDPFFYKQTILFRSVCSLLVGYPPFSTCKLQLHQLFFIPFLKKYSFTRILPFLTRYSFTSSLHEVAGDTWVMRHLCVYWCQNKAWFQNEALYMWNGVYEPKSDPDLKKKKVIFGQILQFLKKKVCRIAVAWQSGAIHAQIW